MTTQTKVSIVNIASLLALGFIHVAFIYALIYIETVVPAGNKGEWFFGTFLTMFFMTLARRFVSRWFMDRIPGAYAPVVLHHWESIKEDYRYVLATDIPQAALLLALHIYCTSFHPDVKVATLVNLAVIFALAASKLELMVFDYGWRYGVNFVSTSIYLSLAVTAPILNSTLWFTAFYVVFTLYLVKLSFRITLPRQSTERRLYPGAQYQYAPVPLGKAQELY